MARNFLMTWNRGQRRWFKKKGGKQYAVSCKELAKSHPQLHQSDTEEGSYRAANQWWQEKNLSIDGQARIDRLFEETDETLKEVYRDFINPMKEALHGRRGGPTLGEVKDAFLIAKQAQVGIDITAGRFENLRRQVTDFVTFFGEATPTERINEGTLTDFHTELNQRIQRKAISPAYGKSIFSTVKQFVGWACENRKIDATPRNLRSRSLRIGVPVTEIKTYSIAQINALLKATTIDKTRLYLLMMLNTGMTQRDLSDLKQSEVDWEAGTITRKRSKTKNSGTVPTVTYPLWDATLTLLRKFGRRDQSPVLVTRDGLPLVRLHLVNGRLKKSDAVRLAWRRIECPIKIGLKHLRKTSATLLGGNKDFASVADLFLGHAPRSMADKHYKQAPMELLADGVRWLGQQYGVPQSYITDTHSPASSD